MGQTGDRALALPHWSREIAAVRHMRPANQGTMRRSKFRPPWVPM
jgi:hypothetical protein